MPYLPYAPGTYVCNIFYPTQDCLTVTTQGMPGVLLNGEAKIFLPADSPYFNTAVEEAASFLQ